MRSALRSSRRPFLTLALALAIGAATVPARAQSYWFESYDRAVKLIDAGRMQEASLLLDRVVRDHPYPIACLRVPGDRCIDYLPYLQRARIQIAAGDFRGASHSLDICEAFGVAQKNSRTARTFLKLRQQIRTMEAAAAGDAPVIPATSPH